MRDSMTVTHSQHIGYRCVHAFAYTFNAHTITVCFFVRFVLTISQIQNHLIELRHSKNKYSYLSIHTNVNNYVCLACNEIRQLGMVVVLFGIASFKTSKDDIMIGNKSNLCRLSM